MCDTLVALGNSTADGRVLFAKNSDRQPNECHVVIRVPRRTYPADTKVKCTYIEIDQAEETYEVLLLKPHWIWGAEMGCNEYGLNIGNEAVFTKEPKGKDSLIGMDMLRIALERCKTSMEAVNMIVRLLEKYGQGGNCGYQKKFMYHNSFLIADRKSAWVLETAGIYWAALEVKDTYSISNRLSIGSKFDMAHPHLIAHAIEKGWCKSKEDFDFAKCYSDQIITHFSGSSDRQSYTRKLLNDNKGRITAKTMMEILRGHTPKYDEKQYCSSSVSSVCMHAGFIYGDQTTGSYVASLGEPIDTYWVTGSSAPCLSLFKPLWLIDNDPMTFTEDKLNEAISFWMNHERLHRNVLEHRISASVYKQDRDRLEKTFYRMVNSISQTSSDQNKLRNIMSYALSEEKMLLERYYAQANDTQPKYNGNPYFKHYWRKMIRKLTES